MTATFKQIKHRLWWLIIPPLVSATAMTWVGARIISDTSRIERLYDAETAVTSLVSVLKDAETGQRRVQSLALEVANLNSADVATIPDGAVERLRSNAERVVQELSKTSERLTHSPAETAAMEEVRRAAIEISTSLSQTRLAIRARRDTSSRAFLVAALASVLLTAVGLALLFALVHRYGAIRDSQDEQLMRLNQTLEERVHARTIELSAANRDLEDFSRIASHDLRAPLRTSTVMLDLFRARHASQLDPSGATLLERVHRSLGRLQALLSDLAAYQSVNQISIAPMEPVSLEEVTVAAISNVQKSLEASAGELKVSALPVVHGNRELLVILFQNLLENAIKYRPSGQAPVIDVRAREQDRFVIVTVSDLGIGFDSAYKDEIFRPFKRLHTADEYEGTGIGLATCARIVERHKGAIWAESERGKGSSFFVKLPLAVQN